MSYMTPNMLSDCDKAPTFSRCGHVDYNTEMRVPMLRKQNLTQLNSPAHEVVPQGKQVKKEHAVESQSGVWNMPGGELRMSVDAVKPHSTEQIASEMVHRYLSEKNRVDKSVRSDSMEALHKRIEAVEHTLEQQGEGILSIKAHCEEDNHHKKEAFQALYTAQEELDKGLQACTARMTSLQSSVSSKHDNAMNEVQNVHRSLTKQLEEARKEILEVRKQNPYIQSKALKEEVEVAKSRRKRTS